MPDGERDHLGLFAQDEIMISEDWSLTLGGRYDYFAADADDVTMSQTSYGSNGAATIASVNKFFPRNRSSRHIQPRFTLRPEQHPAPDR